MSKAQPREIAHNMAARVPSVAAREGAWFVFLSKCFCLGVGTMVGAHQLQLGAQMGAGFVALRIAEIKQGAPHRKIQGHRRNIILRKRKT